MSRRRLCLRAAVARGLQRVHALAEPIDAHSRRGILVEQPLVRGDVLELGWVAGGGEGGGVVLAARDGHDEHANVGAIKGAAQRQQLEEHHAERPRVRRLGVGLAADQLGAHVEGRAAHRLGQPRVGRHGARDAEIGQLHVELVICAAGRRAEEHVCRFEVAVEHLHRVEVGEGARELAGPAHDERRGEGLRQRRLHRDGLGQVAAVGKLHHDGERLGRAVRAVVADDGGVRERGEDTYLVLHRAQRRRVHVVERDLLGHEQRAVGRAAQEDHAAVCTAPKHAHALVVSVVRRPRRVSRRRAHETRPTAKRPVRFS
mmetsp:Transcript_30403/g.63979  ORF Transcript_30403/g.63979 Transcript_30403/m.63979 type:complete len:316 (+) Transcript_30403:671-1618(+)